MNGKYKFAEINMDGHNVMSVMTFARSVLLGGVARCTDCARLPYFQGLILVIVIGLALNCDAVILIKSKHSVLLMIRNYTF